MDPLVRLAAEKFESMWRERIEDDAVLGAISAAAAAAAASPAPDDERSSSSVGPAAHSQRGNKSPSRDEVQAADGKKRRKPQRPEPKRLYPRPWVLPTEDERADEDSARKKRDQQQLLPLPQQQQQQPTQPKHARSAREREEQERQEQENKRAERKKRAALEQQRRQASRAVNDDLPGVDAFSELPPTDVVLSAGERAAVLSQFQQSQSQQQVQMDNSGALQIPRDLGRIRVGLSAALRVSVAVPDETLFDLLAAGRVGANIMLTTLPSTATREVTVQTVLRVACWIKHQFAVHGAVDEAAIEDSPVREQLESAVSEVSDSVALFEAASFTHLYNKMAVLGAAAATAAASGLSSLTSATPTRALLLTPPVGGATAASPARSVVSSSSAALVASAVGGGAASVRVTPRAALAAMHCEPPSNAAASSAAGGAGKKKKKRSKSRRSSSSAVGGAEVDDGGDDGGGSRSSSSSSSSTSRGVRQPAGASASPSPASAAAAASGSGSGGGAELDSDDDDAAAAAAGGGGALKRTASMLLRASPQPDGVSGDGKKSSRKGSSENGGGKNAVGQRRRSPDAEARKELRALMAADPWRQTAAALFASLGGRSGSSSGGGGAESAGTAGAAAAASSSSGTSLAASSARFGTVPFAIIERVVRLMLHRRVESAAVEGAVSLLAHKYDGKRLSLIEFDLDVVRPLARLLGCDSSGAGRGRDAQADAGISSQIRAAQHVIRLFMTPASKQRDDARSKKRGFVSSEELLSSAAYSMERVVKRLADIRVIEPHFDHIFRHSCMLSGTGLAHILELSRFTLQDFVHKVKDNRPIAVNPAMALRRRILDRFVNAVERAARLLHDHSAMCTRCNLIAETLREAINAERQRQTAVARQETFRRVKEQQQNQNPQQLPKQQREGDAEDDDDAEDDADGDRQKRSSSVVFARHDADGVKNAAAVEDNAFGEELLSEHGEEGDNNAPPPSSQRNKQLPAQPQPPKTSERPVSARPVQARRPARSGTRSPFAVSVNDATATATARRKSLTFAPAPPNLVPCATNLTRWSSDSTKEKESDAVVDARKRSGQVREIHRMHRLKSAVMKKRSDALMAAAAQQHDAENALPEFRL